MIMILMPKTAILYLPTATTIKIKPLLKRKQRLDFLLYKQNKL